MKLRPAFATLSLIAAVSMPALMASAQSRGEKVDQIAAALSTGINNDQASDDTVYTDARTGQTIRATPAQLMRETMTAVDFKDMAGRLALEIWSNQTNVPIVINWRALEAQGIDPNTPINLTLGKVPAEQVLRLIVQQLHPDPLGNDQLLLEIEQWYVRVITKEDALRRSTTKLYFIGDLLMDIPNFDNAPKFDLNEALSNTSSGGSNGSGNRGGGEGGGLFPDDDQDREEQVLSKQDKAQQIVDMITQTIEPDIWRENGGEYGSVRYYRGMLVVKAPDFVHEQIGGMTGASVTKSATKRKARNERSSNTNRSESKPQGKRSTAGNVAGVGRESPKIPR